MRYCYYIRFVEYEIRKCVGWAESAKKTLWNRIFVATSIGNNDINYYLVLNGRSKYCICCPWAQQRQRKAKQYLEAKWFRSIQYFHKQIDRLKYVWCIWTVLATWPDAGATENDYWKCNMGSQTHTCLTGVAFLKASSFCVVSWEKYDHTGHSRILRNSNQLIWTISGRRQPECITLSWNSIYISIPNEIKRESSHINIWKQAERKTELRVINLNKESNLNKYNYYN